MKHYLYLMVWFSYCLVSCTDRRDAGDSTSYVVVAGDGIDVPDGEVYLTTVAARASVIDTAKVQGGRFRFEFPEDTEPFKACIAYRNADSTFQLVRFVSRKDTNDHIDWAKISDFFIVEQGSTTLKGFSSHNRVGAYAEIIDGFENRLLFEYDYYRLAKVESSDLELYQEGVERAAKLIDRHPHSFILMERLFWNRAQYKKEDLEALSAKFDQEVQRSDYAYNLNIYLTNCPDDYDPMQAIPLETKKGDYVGNYDRRKKLNMLIFSCSPVCHESTLLLHYLPRQLASMNDKNLYIAELAVLHDRKLWDLYINNNLFLEDKSLITWDQLFVSNARRNQIFHRYNFDEHNFVYDTPYVIFTDDSGNVLKQFNGFTRDVTIQKLQQFITSYLESI